MSERPVLINPDCKKDMIMRGGRGDWELSKQQLPVRFVPFRRARNRRSGGSPLLFRNSFGLIGLREDLTRGVTFNRTKPNQMCEFSDPVTQMPTSALDVIAIPAGLGLPRKRWVVTTEPRFSLGLSGIEVV